MSASGYFYMSKGVACGPVAVGVLESLHKNGLIENDMVCQAGESTWTTYSSLFPKSGPLKKAKPRAASQTVAAIKPFPQRLREGSNYKIGRILIDFNGTLTCIGIVSAWLSKVLPEVVGSIWLLAGSAGVTFLAVLFVIGLMQIAHAFLDAADALVVLANDDHS